MNLTKGRNPLSSSCCFFCSPKAVIPLLSFIFILFYSVSFSQTEQDVCRKWHYVSITDSTGRNAKKTGQQDYMVLSKTDSGRFFQYALKLENIHAQGTWSLQDSIFTFTYSSSAGDKTSPVSRRFKIISLQRRELIMTELIQNKVNGLRFQYAIPEQE